LYWSCPICSASGTYILPVGLMQLVRLSILSIINILIINNIININGFLLLIEGGGSHEINFMKMIINNILCNSSIDSMTINNLLKYGISMTA
jgi:hypothetical protein